MSCSPSDSDSSAVSLSDPNPLRFQIPLGRVSSQCRDYCRRIMSQEAIQCENHCRKYLLLTDTQTGATYRGLTTLIRYLLDPNGNLARITLFVPLPSHMAEQMRGWTFLSRDLPGAIHDFFGRMLARMLWTVQSKTSRFLPSTFQGMILCLATAAMPSGPFGSPLEST